MNIPIVYGCDNNQPIALAASVESVIRNAAGETRYDIYVLTNDLEEKYQEKFKAQVERLNNEFDAKHTLSVVFVNRKIEVKRFLFSHVKEAAYLRAFIPSLLSDLDRAIYLDIDTLVCADLSELYSQDLEGYLVAGVRNPQVTYKREVLGIQEGIYKNYPRPLDQFINSGVLLLNLRELREFQYEEKFVEYAATLENFSDQWILNYLCYDRIKILPFVYNYQLHYFNDYSSYSNKLKKYDINELYHFYPDFKETDSPVIIHFLTLCKPWLSDYDESFNFKFWDTWFKYAETCVEFAKTLQTIKLGNEIRDKRSLIDRNKNWVKRILDRSQIVEAGEKIAISIVVPLKNYGKYIDPLLKSIILSRIHLRQIEVIIVDYGSTDDSLPHVCAYAEQFPFIRVFSTKLGSHGEARNYGTRQARGEYIHFADADDKIHNEFAYYNMYTKAKEYNAVIAHGEVMRYDSKGNEVIKNPGMEADGLDSTPPNVTQVAVINVTDWQYYNLHQCYIYQRRFLIDNHIWFSHHIRSQTCLFNEKALVAARQILVTPTLFYGYCNPKVSGKSNFSIEQFISMVQVQTEIYADAKWEGLPRFAVQSYTVVANNKDKVKKSIAKATSHTQDVLRLVLFNFLSQLDVAFLDSSGLTYDRQLLRPINVVISDYLTPPAAPKTGVKLNAKARSVTKNGK